MAAEQQKRGYGELAGQADDSSKRSRVGVKRIKLSNRFFFFRAEKMLCRTNKKVNGLLRRRRRRRSSYSKDLGQFDTATLISLKEEKSNENEMESSKEEEETEEVQEGHIQEEQEEGNEEEVQEEVEEEEEEEEREEAEDEEEVELKEDGGGREVGERRERKEEGSLVIPTGWENAVKSVVNGSVVGGVIFICGGKNTGKSTFARYLVNSLFSRYQNVGFLDTDVGQPELTPPGLLSLHLLDKPIAGLPQLQMKNPERCYYFGDVSAKSNPEDYLSCIFSLHDYFRQKYYLCHLENGASLQKENMTPLVINTHGWIQGVGFDMLVKIIGQVMPTHIIQIRSKSARRNLPQNQFWESKAIQTAPELIFVDSVIEGNAELAEIKFNARELRDLRILFYFQKGSEDKLLETSQLQSVFMKAAVSLASSIPFQVPISAIKIVHQHQEVPLCESIYSLNASLVGLGVSPGSGKSENSGQAIKPNCVGLGIVRGIDIEKGLLYVITPVDLDELQQVDVFLQGKIEVPVTLLQTPSYISPYLCRNVISIEGTGAAVMGSGRKKRLRT